METPTAPEDNVGPVPPDRSAACPLWRQVGDDLRRRHAGGAFAGGVPGELVLRDEYGVSRHTIREALRDLREEGLIRSRQGRVSVAPPPPPPWQQGLLGGIDTALADARGALVTRVLHQAIVRDSAVAARFALPGRAELVVVERLHLVADRPVAVDSSWVQREAGRPLLTEPVVGAGLSLPISEQLGLHADSFAESVVGSVLGEPEASRLGLATGAEHVAIVRSATLDGRLVEWRRTTVSGAALVLVTRWGTGVPAATRWERPPTAPPT